MLPSTFVFYRAAPYTIKRRHTSSRNIIDNYRLSRNSCPNQGRLITWGFMTKCLASRLVFGTVACRSTREMLSVLRERNVELNFCPQPLVGIDESMALLLLETHWGTARFPTLSASVSPSSSFSTAEHSIGDDRLLRKRRVSDLSLSCGSMDATETPQRILHPCRQRRERAISKTKIK